VDYTRYLDGLDPEYATIVEPLLAHDDVLSMDGFRHHDRTALTHSLAVSTRSWAMARRMRLDAVSVARGALLHDFFLYDWREVENSHHPTMHARVALANARARFSLNPMEEDIIVTHMWPIGKPFYSYRESALVSLVDKYVSTREVSVLFSREFAAFTWSFVSRLGAANG
jgi:uncharacterized protein